MKHLLPFLAVIGLAGCDTTEGDAGIDTDETLECQNGIVEFFPTDAATNVYYRTLVEVEYESQNGDESMTLTDDAGTEVTGTTTWEGNRAIFTPDTPLAADTTYTLTVSYECGEPSISFTTSEIGTPTDEVLIGNTYEMNLGAARFVEPPGVGALIGGLLDDTYVLVGVSAEDVGAQTLSMIGALGVTDDTGSTVQDTCTASIDFPDDADFAENPYFEVNGDLVSIDVEGFAVDIQNLLISGAFASDASYVAGATLAGKIDTRPLGELFGLSGDDPDATCDFLASLQIECADCGDGSIYCLDVAADSMDGELIDGLELVAVTQEEVDANPDCTDESTTK